MYWGWLVHRYLWHSLCKWDTQISICAIHKGLNPLFPDTLACKMKLESCHDAVQASYRWDINSSLETAEAAFGKIVVYKGGT